MAKNYHVVKHEKGWAVKGAGNKRYSSVHRTQRAAIRKAKALAKKARGEVIVQKRSGQVRLKMSYGNDPRWIPG